MASLYQRLGGVEGIASIVDDSVDRHAANPALAARFLGKDLPLLKKFSLQFVSAGSCRPSTHGLGARSADYAGMAFSESELQAVVGDIAAAMRELGLGSPEVGDLVDLLLALNPDGISSPCA